MDLTPKTDRVAVGRQPRQTPYQVFQQLRARFPEVVDTSIEGNEVLCTISVGSEEFEMDYSDRERAAFEIMERMQSIFPGYQVIQADDPEETGVERNDPEFSDDLVELILRPV